MSSPAPTPLTDDELKRRHLEQEVEKLKLEVKKLQQSAIWDHLGRVLGIATAIGAIVSVWVGLQQYYGQQTQIERQFQDQRKKDEDQFRAEQVRRDEDRAKAELERKKVDEQRTAELQREAARPFWDSQLKLYLRAAEAAALVATTDSDEVRAKAEREFWVLYWGPLAIVEDVTAQGVRSKIAGRMVEFGNYIRDTPVTKRDRQRMEQFSLRLAHAMRDATGPSFNLTPAPLPEERRAAQDPEKATPDKAAPDKSRPEKGGPEKPTDKS
ncbi:MAG: hypothetical protein J0I06_10875 [Planctomycetes bacterium]|nr:hypothetical protein [Planctomycetota bacterium]